MGMKTKLEANDKQTDCVESAKVRTKKKWRKPKLEDVSGKVMAQPYIRFT
jgi:hypothetical protein